VSRIGGAVILTNTTTSTNTTTIWEAFEVGVKGAARRDLSRVEIASNAHHRPPCTWPSGHTTGNRSTLNLAIGRTFKQPLIRGLLLVARWLQIDSVSLHQADDAPPYRREEPRYVMEPETGNRKTGNTETENRKRISGSG
jgi:hypothetical protein